MDARFRGFDLTTTDSGVATITFNEPDRLNGSTQATKRDLTELLQLFQMDDTVRVLVITGSGRAFCAGDDMTGRRREYGDDVRALVPDLPRGHHDPMSTYEALKTMSQAVNVAVRALDKPTIAAINGLAIQTGLTLALACDFKIASRDARLGSATLRFGLLPDEGGHALVIQHIGLAKALDFFMLKRIVTADEALELGLINEIVESDELMGRALELAEELAAGPQIAMRMLKRSLYNAADSTIAQAFDDIAARTAVTDHHPDAREGVTAFREKRPPKFG